LDEPHRLDRVAARDHARLDDLRENALARVAHQLAKPRRNRVHLRAGRARRVEKKQRGSDAHLPPEQRHEIDAKRLDAKAPVNAAALVAAGVISAPKGGVRLLGKGELKAKVAFEVYHATAGAIAAVEKAGGSVELIA